MQLLIETLDLETFFDGLSKAPEPILMLDYDGTLAPFREKRDEAVPYPGIRDLLSDLISSSRSRIIIVSGRAIGDLVPLLDLKYQPEIWGSHGAERLDAHGGYHQAVSDEKPAEGMAEAYWWARDNGLLEIAERKPTGIAFHWRGKTDTEIDRLSKLIGEQWQQHATDFGLVLNEFDGGYELRIANVTKANAVNAVAAEAGGTIAYLGDDVTDEDAFKALGDKGLSVLVRPELRETLADLWLKPPEELVEFLNRWHRTTQHSH